jgi:acylphosphatase
MGNDDLIHVSIVVSGHVQGVGFRYSALKAANSFSVNGYVKNLSDGTVLIDAEGSKDNVEAMIEWAREGPPHASVRTLNVTEKKPSYFCRFEIR